jgi:tetratricopeptide (TPR) repeat protein
MASNIESVLDRRSLRRMAGARSFKRGEEYFADGQVGALVEHQGTIVAKVQGTRPYRVKLWVENGELGFLCTCPVGADGAFCKHGIAVGLAWIEGRHPVAHGKSRSKPAVTMQDVRVHLETLDKGKLADMLVDQAMEDDRLRQRLLMKVARKGPKGLDVATYRRAIDEAVDAGEFVHYSDAYDYARGIEETVDSIEELLKDGHAAEVIALSEHTLESVEDAIKSVDDSDGHMGGILERLQEIHHKACKKAKPDPETLARRLFEWELRTDWDTFYGAARTYADVLGEKGLAIYRKLAEAEWAKVPTLGPGRDDSKEYGKRFRITHIMETLAGLKGDVEALVAIRQRDLSSAYAFLQIAETLKVAGMHDLALEWAERGVKAFPVRTDVRLREFLAREYHRLKRHDEAMALIWTGFTESPALEQYRILKAHADRIGLWIHWREKALEHLRDAIAKAKDGRKDDGWGRYVAADHSDFVRIFLWEKDVEAAWREARAGGCSDGLWMELAGKREKEHPEGVLPIYKRQIERTYDESEEQPGVPRGRRTASENPGPYSPDRR